MNDPHRRRSPDGFDDDAIFADIVAHMNDEAPEPAARRKSDDPATGAEPAPGEPAPGEPAGETAEGTTRRAGVEPKHEAAAEPAVPPGDRPEDEREQRPGDPPGSQAVEAEAQAALGPQAWRAHEVDDADEDHFEAPPVSPLPAGDVQFWAIIAGMGGGPLLLLYIVFFNRDVGGYWILAAIAMSIAGFALLVSRMPGHHDEDDDGARL